MTILFFRLIALFAISISFADELIDDFENGGTKNKRNHDWYYFSDVKDDGNSIIYNAQELPNGSYSAFTPVIEGFDSGYCAKLSYLLGDTTPDYPTMEGHREKNLNFVGIGTDIARPGDIADISSATGISFKAKSNDTLSSFVFEIVTSDIYDYGYYCLHIDITKEWKTYAINFEDLGLPGTWANEVDLNLSKVTKFNWKMMGWREFTSDSCNLYLDDIVLLGMNPPVAIKYNLKNNIEKNRSADIIGNLMGRKLGVSDFSNKASGIYVQPQGKTFRIKNVFYK